MTGPHARPNASLFDLLSSVTVAATNRHAIQMSRLYLRPVQITTQEHLISCLGIETISEHIFYNIKT